MCLKVKGADARVTLALRNVEETRKRRRPSRKIPKLDDLSLQDEDSSNVIQVPFASGQQTEARFVFSGSGDQASSKWRVGRLNLFEIGPTPYEWTRLPRLAIHAIEKNIFKTDRLLPLIGIGVLLLLLGRKGRVLTMLGAVPAYYLCAQSVFHTEYRYILAIHYFLFVFAATGIFGAVVAIRNWREARSGGVGVMRDS